MIEAADSVRIAAVVAFDLEQLFVDAQRRERIADRPNLADIVDGTVADRRSWCRRHK